MNTRDALIAIASVCLMAGFSGCAVEQDRAEQTEEGSESESGPAGKGDFFGEDDRKDPTADGIPDRYLEWARSTALMTTDEEIVENDNGQLQLASDETFGEANNLCADARFTEQPVVDGCSSFLVAPDVVVTAGHCLEGYVPQSCDETRIVFDYGIYEEGEDPTNISEDQVYQCDEFVASTYEGNELDQADYAVMTLENPVEDREPLDLSSDGSRASTGDHMTLIGHPDGLPVKIDDGGVVFHTTETRFVGTNDSFAGHSGSAVLNTATGGVEAVHVASGGERFVQDEQNDCRRPKQCQQANVDADQCVGSIGVHTEIWRQHVRRAVGDSNGGDTGVTGDTGSGSGGSADTGYGGTYDTGTGSGGTSDVSDQTDDYDYDAGTSGSDI